MNYTEPKVIYTCFPGGKHKVLTMSYDDGRLEDRRLVELFNRYGIRGTFNLNGGLPRPERIPESEWVELYKGHEVACHTYHHPTISRSPLDQTARQVLADRMQLEGVMGYPVRGLAYPNGSWTPEIAALLPALGIRYARVVGDTHDFAMPHDFMTWKATCHHTHNLLEDGKRFVELYKTQYLYMMYVWGHSFEFRTEEDWALMEQFCQLAAGARTPGTPPTSRSWTTWPMPPACSTPPRAIRSATPTPSPSGSRWTAATMRSPPERQWRWYKRIRNLKRREQWQT